MIQMPTIETYYSLAWRWIVLLCAALVVYTGAGRPIATFFPMLLAFALVTPWARPLLRMRTLLVVGCCGWAGIWVLTNFGRIVDANDLASAMIEVVVSALPIALIYRTRYTSYWLALLSTTLISIGCLLFKGDIIAYSILMLYLGCLTFALNSGHLFFLTRHVQEAKSNLPPLFFNQFIAVIPVGILASALIFFAFPRVKNLGASFGLRSDQPSSGYRGDISLGGGRAIDEDLALAFSVEMEEKNWLQSQGLHLYFRGDSLSHFDGQNWFANSPKRWTLQPGDHRVNKDHDESVYHARIYREPGNHQPIFYPGSLLSLQMVSARMGAIVHDGKGGVFRDRIDYRRYTYDVGFAVPFGHSRYDRQLSDYWPRIETSLTSDPHPHQLSHEQYANYLQIPEGYGEGSFFAQWRSSVPIEISGLSVGQAIDALVAYFDANFEASLINEFSSAESFLSFLSEDRRGHCEYFATATALYFRSHGVPSRVVVGYRGGIYNPVSEVLEVRERNAHAWVEIFMPDAGWIIVDTTPLAPPTGYSRLAANVRMYMSAFQFWFGRYIINYSRDTQRDLVSSFKNLKDLRTSSFDWSTIKGIVPQLMLVLVLFGLIFYLWRRHHGPTRFAGFPQYYRQFLEKLATSGWERKTGESIRGFHQRLHQVGLDRISLAEIERVVERDLYSDEVVPESDRRHAEQVIANLEVPRKAAS